MVFRGALLELESRAIAARDREHLKLLTIIRRRSRIYAGTVRKCRACGCTDDDCSGCIARTGMPCSWVEHDLCSACAGER